MNEDELKELWKSAEAKDTPTIDFDQILKDMNNWKGKLRRRIEIESVIGIVVLIIYLALLFIYPHGLYILPIILIIYIWSYRNTWLLYRNLTRGDDIVSTKEYLEDRTRELTDYIKKIRIFAVFFVPPYVFVAFYISAIMDTRTKEFFDFGYLSTHPDLIYVSIIFCVFLSIVAIIFAEISIRTSYQPSLNKIKELLKQLESE